MRFLEAVKKWLGEVIEIGLLLVAVGIIVQILFGGEKAVPFFGGIVANLTGLVSTFGENGLAGLIAVSIIVWLFYRKRATA